MARLELSKDKTDFDVVDQAFIAGRNYPEDVRFMGYLFKWFRNISYIREARNTWERGDKLIAEFQILGETIHQRIAAKKFRPEDIPIFLAQIDAINTKLTAEEDHFSFVLGDAARWLNRLLSWLMLSVTFLFLLLGLYIAYIISRSLVNSVTALQTATAQVGQGQLNARIPTLPDDELGKLAISFNQMTENLAQAQTSEQQAKDKLAKRAEELALANKKITEHEKLKSEFFSNISHELRTPLALIMAPLDSLLSGQFGTLNSDGTALLHTMHNNAMRLLQMVQGLLDFQKLEAHKVQVKREAIDIAYLTNSLFDDFKLLMQKRHIKGHCFIDPKIKVVEMDRYLYERILFNLLSNAIKFTPSGGEIDVKLTMQSENQLLLSVKDTGIGIPASQLPLLFQRFKQVEGASTRRFEGAGLGLALVKEFAELLAGNVHATSEIEKGSSFTVELFAPISTKPPAAIEETKEERERTRLIEQHEITFTEDQINTSDGSQLPLILVAEDNQELALYMSKILQNICRVQLARDGEEALEKVLKIKPDLIISDVMMPRRDGISLCKALKANESTKNIPFIILTALTYREALLKGWEAGADDYLFKPFHPEELQVRIRAVLSASDKLIQESDKRTEVEQTLKEREAQLLQSQKMEAIGLLAGGIAHDFNNQLSIIMGESETALYKLESNHPLNAKFRHIQKAGLKLDALTKQLLAFSRKQILKPIVLDPSEVISETEKTLRFLLTENIEFTTIRGKNVGNVYADPVQMEQAIINLVNNARDAMPNGGQLTIAVHHVNVGPHENVQYPQITPGPYAVISVTDTGAGMEPAILQRIFEPFFTTKEIGKGTGLGLSMVQGFVEQSGGHVLVESQPGQGTTFKIYMPCTLEKPAQPSEISDKPFAPSRNHETILVVEDDKNLREMLESFFKSCGYHVVTASDGEDALEVIKNNDLKTLHLLLTDVVMPKMNGKELANKILKQYPQAKVIYMSGYNDNIIAKENKIDPSINYFQKPLNLSALSNKISEVLS